MTSKIEHKLLQYGLLLAVFYMFYQTAAGIFSSASVRVNMLNLLVSLFLVVLLLLSYRLKKVDWISLAFHLFLIPVFYFFYKLYGGFAGTVPSLLCVYFGFIISTSTGVFSIVSLMLYTAFSIVLIYFPATVGIETMFGNGPATLVQLSIDFFVVACIIALFIVYLKNKFLKYRRDITTRNWQLQRIAITQQQQNEDLRRRQEEIQSINDNLESIIEERTRIIEEKNHELSEYAFINAHMLRAPVCRILGLINLIEMEESNGAEIQEIKKVTKEVDAIIRNINSVVN